MSLSKRRFKKCALPKEQNIIEKTLGHSGKQTLQSLTFPSIKVKVTISCLGILHICNLWILIVIYLVGRNFYLRGFFAVKVDESDVIVGTPECFNIQTRHKFENFCLFPSNSTYSIQNQVRYQFSMSITVCFRYEQIPTVTSLQPTLIAKKSAKIRFSTDKIYYNFSQEYPKITNM